MSAAPAAAELHAAVRKVLHSRSFEKFIGAAVDNALEEAALFGSAVQLQMPAVASVEFSDTHAGLFVMSAAFDCLFRLYLRRPIEGKHYAVPGWYGNECRVDQDGRLWSRVMGRMVVNDFGNLVEVPSP